MSNELNIKSSTVELIVNPIVNFLKRIAEPVADEIGATLQDNIKYWRFNNQLRNLEKVKKKVQDKNLNIKQVNLKIMFNYLDGVANEDDENIQNIWANLLTNYIDSEKNLVVNVYPLILRQLASNELTILKYFDSKDGEIRLEEVPSEINYTNEEISNLERLGLISKKNVSIYLGKSKLKLEGSRYNPLDKAFRYYKLTDFGYDFLKACSD